MSTLPQVPAAVVAETVDALPARLRRRLDEVLQAARSWPIRSSLDGCTVEVDSETTVTVRRPVRLADDLSCSCLLAPRCLHRAAVAGLAPVAEPEPGPSDPASDPGAAPPDGTKLSGLDVPRSIGPPERTAARLLWDAATAVLNAGVPGSGAVPQASLLRAAHEARVLRLHRAASAAVRVVTQLRAAHAEDPAFRLGDLLGDERELLEVAHSLRSGRPVESTARRAYRSVGDVRLYGLCVEPLVTSSGYAGVVTYLADAQRRIWQVVDVQPGGAGRAAAAADTPVSVGEARLTHRELARAGLLTSGLRASADGRISSGRAVRAVRSGGVRWDGSPLIELWQQPLAEQLDRCLRALDVPVEQRAGGDDLVFVSGTIVGTTRDGVLVAVAGSTILAVPSHDSPRLSYVDNLRLLGRARGLSLRMVARPVGAGRLAVLAVSADGMGDHHGGHVDLGVDRLGLADLPVPVLGPAEAAVDVPISTPHAAPPWHLLGRRVERALEGGRSAVPGDLRDVQRFRAVALPGAADLVERLEAACRVGRDAFGRATVGDDDEYGLAWLAAATYLKAAVRAADWSLSARP